MTGNRIYSILYIEDNPANRQLVQLILEQKSYLALSLAERGGEGIAMAKHSPPDLVLLDISLPDMSGYAVLTALRTDPATEKIPVIAISGDFPPQIPPNIQHMFDKYLPKPIEILPLYQAIDELLHI
ncbi:MAG: response regulator [Desulforhopalus sp.]|nr:response regulator [Desulforhopalus sp.]